MKFNYQKLPLHQSSDPSAPWAARPYIPVYLQGASQSTESPYYALLDSGADNILMPSELAEVIGIRDVRTGNPMKTIGVGGQIVDLFFHQAYVQVQGDGRRLPVAVGFGDAVAVPLLGREFFRHFRQVVFQEEKECVELRV